MDTGSRHRRATSPAPFQALRESPSRGAAPKSVCKRHFFGCLQRSDQGLYPCRRGDLTSGSRTLAASRPMRVRPAQSAFPAVLGAVSCCPVLSNIGPFADKLLTNRGQATHPRDGSSGLPQRTRRGPARAAPGRAPRPRRGRPRRTGRAVADGAPTPWPSDGRRGHRSSRRCGDRRRRSTTRARRR